MKNYRSSGEKFTIITGAINTDITVIEHHHKYGTESQVYYRLRGQFFEGAKNGLSELNNALVMFNILRLPGIQVYTVYSGLYTDMDGKYSTWSVAI